MFHQPSTDFSLFLPLSRLFHSLPFTSAFVTIVPKNVPDYSSFYDVLQTYYIRFENVHCSYINLIVSKNSISSLKAFGSLCCHFHKNKTGLVPGVCFFLKWANPSLFSEHESSPIATRPGLPPWGYASFLAQPTLPMVHLRTVSLGIALI